MNITWRCYCYWAIWNNLYSMGLQRWKMNGLVRIHALGISNEKTQQYSNNRKNNQWHMQFTVKCTCGRYKMIFDWHCTLMHSAHIVLDLKNRPEQFRFEYKHIHTNSDSVCYSHRQQQQHQQHMHNILVRALSQTSCTMAVPQTGNTLKRLRQELETCVFINRCLHLHERNTNMMEDFSVYKQFIAFFNSKWS